MKLQELSAITFATTTEQEITELSCPFSSQSILVTLSGLAAQASQAVQFRCGDTVILGTIVTGPPPANADFRPLTVDYYERPSAVGQIPGNFQKRELRQSDNEIKVSRLIDRAIRPLFDEIERREVSITIQVLSASKNEDIVGLSLTLAALLASLSPLPFNGPMVGFSHVRNHERWVTAATQEGLVMIEGSGPSCDAESLLDDIQSHVEAYHECLSSLAEMVNEYGDQKEEYIPETELLESPEIDARIDTLAAILLNTNKRQRERDYQQLLAELQASIDAPANAVELTLWSLARGWLRAEALAGRRQDGRAPNELRPMQLSGNILPQSSGSALVTRGMTQVLVSVTKGDSNGAPFDEQLFSRRKSPLFCHYNFPGYSTQQLRSSRVPNRREIGHGLLIQGGLIHHWKHPNNQSARILADVLSSDGSSSMASVCGATLALAEAGIPLSTPLVGVSVGLVQGEEEATLLLDISGDEDFYGDMDFKVVGDGTGITALQLDNKIGALPWDLLKVALNTAQDAHRCLISELENHLEGYEAPTPKYSKEVEIHASRVGAVIGRGGRTLKGICSEFQVKVDISDEQVALITGQDEALVQAAAARVLALGTPLKVDSVHDAKVEQVKDFGVFVRFGDHGGLVHISKLDIPAGTATSDRFDVGQALTVRVLGVDDRGRLQLGQA